MSGVTFKTTIEGVDKLSRELKLAVPATKARVVAAIRKNAQAIAAKARAKAPHRSGKMAGTIRDEYAGDGLIGMVKVGVGKLPRRGVRGRTIGVGAQAPLIERGDPRRKRKPQPFLNPALAAQRPTAINDINTALNQSVEEIGNG